jgi:hypothetical protein
MEITIDDELPLYECNQHVMPYHLGWFSLSYAEKNFLSKFPYSPSGSRRVKNFFSFFEGLVIPVLSRMKS